MLTSFCIAHKIRHKKLGAKVFSSLNKEVPDQTQSKHEVPIGIRGCRVVILFRKKGIEVFQGEKHPHRLYPEIDKIIHEWKSAELTIILQVELRDQWIVGIHVIFPENALV